MVPSVPCRFGLGDWRGAQEIDKELTRIQLSALTGMRGLTHTFLRNQPQCVCPIECRGVECGEIRVVPSTCQNPDDGDFSSTFRRSPVVGEGHDKNRIGIRRGENCGLLIHTDMGSKAVNPFVESPRERFPRWLCAAWVAVPRLRTLRQT